MPADYLSEAWEDVLAALKYEIAGAGEAPELTVEAIEAHQQSGVDCAWARGKGRASCGGCLRQDLLLSARASIR